MLYYQLSFHDIGFRGGMCNQLRGCARRFVRLLSESFMCPVAVLASVMGLKKRLNGNTGTVLVIHRNLNHGCGIPLPTGQHDNGNCK